MSHLKGKSTLLFSSLLFIALSINANAQIGKRIKERIKQSTEKKLEDKVVDKAGKKTDQVLDSLFKERKKPGRVTKKSTNTEDESGNDTNSNSNAKSQSSGFDFGGFTNATYEDSYQLNQEFKIEIRTREKNKKEEITNMDMYYGEDCYMIVLQEEKDSPPVQSLMDLKNNTSVVLNDEEMSGVAISMDFMTGRMVQVTEDYEDSLAEKDFTFEKTGRTKMIAGYSCDEYRTETDEQTLLAWYTDDIKIEMYDNLSEYSIFANWSKGMKYGSNGELTGTMMESHMVEKTGDQQSFDYYVKEVNLVKKTMNMSDYTFMSM